MTESAPSTRGKLEYDLIVVGAGMAGSAAAAIAARNGLKVALVERGHAPGGKNYFGGAVYTHALREIYPDALERKPPLERPITQTGFWFLSRDGAVKATVEGGKLGGKPADSFVALRAKFDHWWAEQAQKEGAFLIPKTTVADFLRDGRGRIVGVLTDRPQGEICAPVTIVCEGINNLLVRKLGLIRRDLKPKSVALACKQLIALPAETVNARFGFADSSRGLAVTVMGDVSMGFTGMGFIYTGAECLSVGLGVTLEQLGSHQVRLYELLQRFLNHPVIAPLVEGGKLLEYGAHLIPEGGWRDMPVLYTDGALVAGDAASMVNALHWEGTNMAILAGKEAALTALAAHSRRDFSAKSLSEYRRRLEKTFILKDLRQYRNMTRFLETHPSFLEIYPAFLNDGLGLFFSGYGKPKRRVYWEILRSLTRRRNPLAAAMDMISFGRAVVGI
jgi:electron transfer flavoprotein-quinone oxidoreductase